MFQRYRVLFSRGKVAEPHVIKEELIELHERCRHSRSKVNDSLILCRKNILQSGSDDGVSKVLCFLSGGRVEVGEPRTYKLLIKSSVRGWHGCQKVGAPLEVLSTHIDLA